MSRRLRKFPALAAVAVAALLLSACGSSHTRVTSGTYAGESGANAPYLDAGPLAYEVQLSRELSPFDIEDSAYLGGLSQAQRTLPPGQEWFGVFLQVYNNTSGALPAATNITITDTQGNVYTPVLPSETNPFVYRAGVVPAKGRLPEPGTIAADGPTQGALLLYKIATVSLDNRPLTVRIVDPEDALQTASAELDV
jgi:hypothetical protein